MGNSYRKQLNNIRTEIGKIGHSFAIGLAKQAHEDLIEAHTKIIDQFYDAHDPSSYNRYGGLYDSLMSHGIKHMRSKTYQAGIIVGGAGMSNHYNSNTIDQNNVFDLMWNKGVRGLPKQGNNPLSHSYTFNGISFREGEVWRNPYWSGQNDPYHNVFVATLTIGNYTTSAGVPNMVMMDFVNHWDKANGFKTCDKLYKEIKNKYK